MAHIYPFRAVQYTRATHGPTDLSTRIAPPYDVLDAAAKRRLLDRDPWNIVAVDLPHLPAKELGPPAAYQAAGATLREWLATGIVRRADRPAMHVYRQTFTSGARSLRRTGLACTIETLPFGPRLGGGVLPHEQTFSGPKEDRLALMRATQAQLSPIFGIHEDARGAASEILEAVASSRGPDLFGDMGDGVRHEVWTVEDGPTLAACRDALAGEDVFIADGHHRYNTALNHLASLERAGPVGPDHPARRCMIVLVGMSDPGLEIWPTHRVLGGMRDYSLEKFIGASRGHLRLEILDTDASAEPERWLAAAGRAYGQTGNILGLYDFAENRLVMATLAEPDPLAARFADKPRSWRTLDVALIQHLIVEQICEPMLNGGDPVSWAFPHTVEEVLAIGSGRELGSGGGRGFAPQLAILVQPTPLEAVREISRAGVLMPQKSTFFYPKLATGLFINPVA